MAMYDISFDVAHDLMFLQSVNIMTSSIAKTRPENITTSLQWRQLRTDEWHCDGHIKCALKGQYNYIWRKLKNKI
jgi:hypothetical protein